MRIGQALQLALAAASVTIVTSRYGAPTAIFVPIFEILQLAVKSLTKAQLFLQHKGCKLICWTPELAGGRQVCGTGTCVCKNAASTNDNQPRPKPAGATLYSSGLWFLQLCFVLTDSRSLQVLTTGGAEEPQQPSEEDAPDPWKRDENGVLEQAPAKDSVTEKLTPSDFVIAFNTYHQNKAVAAAGRYSRQVRIFHLHSPIHAMRRQVACSWPVHLYS